ncbi:MAG: HK97-gp10 family putative phage morphogenesis protein [Elusimicrobiales bacterium]
MGDITVIQLDGIPELELALKNIRGPELRRATVRAVKKGAEVIRAQAAANAPYDPGVNNLFTKGKPETAEHIKDNIGVTISTDPLKGEVRARIGLHWTVWYGRLVEFGHALAVRSHKSGNRWFYKVVGRVEAKPFMRPAFDAKKEEAIQACDAEYRRLVAKYGGQSDR